MRTIFLTGALPGPAPAFETLAEDPDAPGARLLPPGGWVTIGGEEWGFTDVRSITVSDGVPYPAVITGLRPTICAPFRAKSINVTITVAPTSVIEAADEPPIVRTGFGDAKWGSA